MDAKVTDTSLDVSTKAAQSDVDIEVEDPSEWLVLLVSERI